MPSISNIGKLRNKITIATNDVIASKVSLDASKIAFKTQKQAFEIIQNQYSKGNIGNYEFLESKSKLFRNTSEYIKAKYDIYFKTKILKFYFKR